MNPLFFVKAKRWAQNPPSPAKIKFMAAILCVLLLIYGFEQIFGWPEALSPNNLRAPR